MNDRAALYAAILAHPDEDTPRLAYADWLEEHGDAKYAEFIRLQIEMAREPWGEVALRDFYRPAEERTYYEPPSAVKPDTSSWGIGFHRGFPGLLTVNFDEVGSKWFKKLSELFNRAPIARCIVVSAGDEIPHWNEFLSNSCFTKIRKLTLDLLTTAQTRQLITSPQATGLRELEVSVYSEETATLLLRSQIVTQLDALTISFGPSRSKEIVTAARSFLTNSKLRRLQLSGWKELWEGVRDSFPDTLEELIFWSNDFGRGGLVPFARSFRGDKLRSLTFTGPLDEKDMGAIAVCAGLSGLQRLELSGCGLKTRAVQALAKSPHLGSLLYLGLSENPIGDGGTVALAKSPHLANLLVLYARCDGFTDRTGEAVLNAPFASRMIYLDLVRPGRNISPAMKRKLGKRFKWVNV
jgi:uncharacterized protein (TIGR02996 family)